MTDYQIVLLAGAIMSSGPDPFYRMIGIFLLIVATVKLGL